MSRVLFNDIPLRDNSDLENNILFALSLHCEANISHTIKVLDDNDFVVLTLFN